MKAAAAISLALVFSSQIVMPLVLVLAQFAFGYFFSRFFCRAAIALGVGSWIGIVAATPRLPGGPWHCPEPAVLLCFSTLIAAALAGAAFRRQPDWKYFALPALWTIAVTFFAARIGGRPI